MKIGSTKQSTGTVLLEKNTLAQRWKRDFKVNYILYIMIIPVIVYYVLFSYIPMAGIQLAFKNYQIKGGIWGSPWIEFAHFKRFLSAYNFKGLMVNTIWLSVYGLIVGTITPIVFSVFVNYVRNTRWKKTLQMVTYLPYFISTVVLVGMLFIFLGDKGVISVVMGMLGKDGLSLMAKADTFRGVYTWSGAWQGLGFGSVIYIAALASVDMQIHEAAIVDGASIWRRIWHIDLVEIRPTVLVLFILGLGGIINVGYEKVLLMQNALNISTSEVLSTFVYKVGLVSADYGYSTAVGLFNSLISMVLLLLANYGAKKLSDFSMW